MNMSLLSSRSSLTGFRCSVAGRPSGHSAKRALVTMRVGGAPDAAMQEAMKKAMADPKMAAQLEAMQAAMQKPEVQSQMSQMQAMMSNPQLQQRMQQLRSDPEFEGFFKELQTGGMQALMKFYNDPKFLSKLGEKLGDVVPPPTAVGAQAAAMGAPAAPEIKDMLDAAKYGDMEAVEDFIAIGKDVNMKDSESRTPLHFAAGFNQLEIAKMLLEEGAQLEATDSKGNTPLHYAAGYGRPDLVSLLLAAGASKKAENANKKTAHALATADSRNPVSQMADLISQLLP